MRGGSLGEFDAEAFKFWPANGKSTPASAQGRREEASLEEICAEINTLPVQILSMDILRHNQEAFHVPGNYICLRTEEKTENPGKWNCDPSNRLSKQSMTARPQ
jgi:hypothetical protein